MKSIFKKTVAVSLMLSIAFPTQIVGPALAEDIDIYAANTGTSTNPNILVVIDNSANWSSAAQHWPSIKQGQAELKSLRTVISELGSDVNLGLMMFTPGSGTAKDGSYVRFHVRQMTADNKTAFQEMLGNPSGCTNGTNSLNGTPNCIYQNFDDPSEKVGTAKTDYSAAMFEVFKYFGGYTNPANASLNTAGSPVDASHYGALRYGGDPDSKSDAGAYSATYMGVSGAYSDASCGSKACYNPPLSSTNSCAKNYVIFIGNGYPSQDSGTSLLSNVGCSTSQLSVPDLAAGSTTTPTLLASNQVYANQAACEAAALSAYGDSYNSYTCTLASSSSNTVTTDLAPTACGVYANATACSEAETTANAATYDSVSCTVLNANCGATTSLPDSACNEFASQAACQAQTTVGGVTYDSVACTQKAGNCSFTQTGTATSSCRADSASCVSNAASDLAGYTSYSCGATVTAGCSYTASATASACFASSAACSAGASAALPGYTSYSCGAAGAACTVSGSVRTGCTGTNLSGGNCSAANVAAWISGYSSYTCESVANCTGGNKDWSITGSTPGNSYTITGSKTLNTGNTYAITATRTNTTGISFSRVGAGAPASTFNRIGSKTTTTNRYNVYGNTVVTTQVPTGTFSGTSANNADEWARCLYQTDVSSATGKQSITTYTIDVFKDAQDADQTKLMMSMARAGGGKYFAATNEDAIKNALRQIFSEIQSVNSVFASSSLPVSVNTQGTYLNQVFMGMFRPDGSSRPRWFGNLKQYQFKKINGTLRLADKNGDEAISSSTGFITPCADSYWTTDTGTYWTYAGQNAQGNCTAQTSAFPSAGSSSAYSDAPDGNVVEKGGAAQRLRGASSAGGTLVSSTTRYAECTGSETPSNANCRILKTCDNANCSALTDFTTSNATITAAALGVADDAAKNALVSWVRGQDLDDENGNTTTNEVRPSVHGGVVHSQPAAVDYGDTYGVVTYYGADDGVFHAIDGDKTDGAGTELWGFIAPETYGRLNRLRSNTTLVSLPGVSAMVSQPKDYFFDGSIGVYQNGATVWIYPTMRRGGRAIYAFDVSNPTNPSLKWRKGCFTSSTSDDSNCSAGWTAIGQTWSKPKIAKLSGYSSPVLVFGGGYDSCEDTASTTRCTGSRKGAGIWFVDADTGNIIRYYPTNYSVPGEIALLKDGNGNVTYAYAADSGGYVYRINVGTYNGTTASGWSSNSAATDIDIADLSSSTDKERKFLFGPDVVAYSSFNAVLIGSGDREHPLYGSYACPTTGTGVTNEFYMLKDTPSGYAANIVPGDLYDVTDVDEPEQETLDEMSGWRFSLGACEQVVNKALTIGGTTYFGTNTPIASTDACATNLGTARGYAVNFLSGSGHDQPTTYVGGGMPPSPVGGVADVDGSKEVFCIGCITPPDDPQKKCDSALQACEVNVNPTGARSRVYWYLLSD